MGPTKKPSDADLDEVQKAAEFFETVVRMVKASRLPGPIVPDLLAKVVQLSNNPDVSFGDVARFCSQHQALSAKLLTVANSAVYLRGGARITSLEKAVARMGLRQASAVLHAVATRSYLMGKDPDLRRLIMRNLETAYVVALAGKMVAEMEKHPRADDVYTVGLFHNIGCTFFIYTLSLLQDNKQVHVTNMEAVSVVARRRGPEFNRLLCHEMALPDDIVAALLFPADPPPATRLVVRCVHRAMWAAERLLMNRHVEDLQLDVEGDVMGVTQDLVEALRTAAPQWLSLLESYQGGG